jgi:CHAD domain-containing protein
MREALRLRWRKYRKGLARCRRRTSEDAVHDLRIESRRLLATLDALGGLVPRRTLQAATRAIKKRTKGLGSLRDIQVQRATVHDLSQQLTGLEGLAKRLARDERRRVAATARRLKRHTARGAADAISSVKRALRRPLHRSVGSAGRPLVPALTAALEAVEARFAAINPAQPHTIHRARRELRRFRYLAEVFEPVVPAITQGYLDHLQELQGEMGRIQDATVLNATVDRYLRKHANGDADPARTHDVLERRREELLRAFLNRQSRVPDPQFVVRP